METKRIALPSILATRKPTVTKDGLLTNCYSEKSATVQRIVKRPGLLVSSTLAGECPGQGAYYFIDTPVFVKCDTLYTTIPEPGPDPEPPPVLTPYHWVWVVQACCGYMTQSLNSDGCTFPATRRVWTYGSNWPMVVETEFEHPPLCPPGWTKAQQTADVAAAIPIVHGIYYNEDHTTGSSQPLYPFEAPATGFYDLATIVYKVSPCILGGSTPLREWDIANGMYGVGLVDFYFVWIMPDNIIYELTLSDFKSGVLGSDVSGYGVKESTLDGLKSWGRPIHYQYNGNIYWTP